MVSCIDSKLSKKEIKENIFEYKMNQIIQLEEEYRYDQFTFADSEFYSYDINNKFDSGTNILYFYLKLENLNNDEIILSEKKSIFDVFLGNIKILLNNFKRHKTLWTTLKLNNTDKTAIKLEMKVEFDPYTLSNIFNKILVLLQNMISYKVIIDHKFKLLVNYFDDFSQKIESQLNEAEKEESCIIF